MFNVPFHKATMTEKRRKTGSGFDWEGKYVVIKTSCDNRQKTFNSAIFNNINYILDTYYFVQFGTAMP